MSEEHMSQRKVPPSVAGEGLNTHSTLSSPSPAAAHPKRRAYELRAELAELLRSLPADVVLEEVRSFYMSTQRRFEQLPTNAQKAAAPLLAGEGDGMGMLEQVRRYCGDGLDRHGFIVHDAHPSSRCATAAAGMAWVARTWVDLHAEPDADSVEDVLRVQCDGLAELVNGLRGPQ